MLFIKSIVLKQKEKEEDCSDQFSGQREMKWEDWIVHRANVLSVKLFYREIDY